MSRPGNRQKAKFYKLSFFSCFSFHTNLSVKQIFLRIDTPFNGGKKHPKRKVVDEEYDLVNYLE